MTWHRESFPRVVMLMLALTFAGSMVWATQVSASPFAEVRVDANTASFFKTDPVSAAGSASSGGSSAFSSADLASGTLVVSANASGPTDEADAFARLSDVIKFSSPLTPWTATGSVSMDTTGAILGSGLGTAEASVALASADSGAPVQFRFASTDCNSPALGFSGPLPFPCTQLPPGGGSFFQTLTLFFTVTDTNPFLSVDFLLAGEASGSTVNFSDPITITIPPGFTFTSASGVFLTKTKVVAPVPEPGTLTLMTTGLLGPALLRRRLTAGGREARRTSSAAGVRGERALQ